MSAGRFEGFGADALNFLRALDFHQSREWFADNRALYERELREPLSAFCEEAAGIARNAGFDVVFDRKKGPFRINRDVRFSKDKRPYNRHVSAVLSPDGTKGSFGVLYVHIGLEECFLAAGYWALPKDELNLFRRQVLTYPERYHAMLDRLDAASLTLDEANCLKRTPRGWDEPDDERSAHALRLRGFTVDRPISQDAIFDRSLLNALEGFAQDAVPLMSWGAPILR